MDDITSKLFPSANEQDRICRICWRLILGKWRSGMDTCNWCAGFYSVWQLAFTTPGRIHWNLIHEDNGCVHSTNKKRVKMHSTVGCRIWRMSLQNAIDIRAFIFYLNRKMLSTLLYVAFILWLGHVRKNLIHHTDLKGLGGAYEFSKKFKKCLIFLIPKRI